jgi:hypothetical protein
VPSSTFSGTFSGTGFGLVCHVAMKSEICERGQSGGLCPVGRVGFEVPPSAARVKLLRVAV